MAGRARQVVIGGIACRDLTPFGLQRDQGVAPAHRCKPEHAVVTGGVGGGVAPGGVEFALQVFGQGLQGGAVVGQRPGQGFGLQDLLQRCGGGGAAPRLRLPPGYLRTGERSGGEALGSQVLQDRLGRGQRIEADGMGEVPLLAGIGGQDHRKAAVGAGGGVQPVPGGHPVGDGGDAGGVGAVGEARELQVGIAFAWALEAGDPGEDATVNLGQHHMHRQIGGRQTAFRPGPVTAAGGGQGNLEHRGIAVERRGAILALCRKGGGVDDGGGGKRGQRRPHPCRMRALQRWREQAMRGEPPVAQRADQGIDGIGVGGAEVTAVEGDGDGRAVRRRGTNHPPVGVVPAALGHRLVACHRPGIQARRQCQLRQRRLCRHRPPGLAQRGQPAQGGDGQRGQRIQPRIRPAVGRQHGKGDAMAAGQVLQGGKAIGPIAFAADQADEYAACMGQNGFGIGIDRDRVFQRDKILQPQGGQSAHRVAGFRQGGQIAHRTGGQVCPMPARRERAKVAVGKRQHHQIGRGLAGVIGAPGFLQPMAFAEDDVHQAPSTARIAASSMS